MKILFYNTNSNKFDAKTFHFEYFPECKTKLEVFCNKYPEHQIVVVTQTPGMFLLDLTKDKFENKAQNVKYILADEKSNEKIIQIIKEELPDFAIALSSFFKPFDWQSINDSLIACELQKSNIKAICTDKSHQLVCFDKKLTQDFLENNKFEVPESLYVDHRLFWAERNQADVKENVYKNYILDSLKDFNFPVIIKDTTGLSSYGMEVCVSYNQAKAYLISKKNNGNKLIQELIEGEQFGLEVYGTDQNYFVSSPFRFSVNQYKITSPKQSIKIGPVIDSFYKVDELKSEIKRLCTLLKIQGMAQIDLVFKNGKWYIIEINPRLSGMTNSVCQSLNTTYFDLIFKTCILNEREFSESNQIMAIKLPVLTEQKKTELKQEAYIKQINQTVNEAAKQTREEGYCEIIIEETGTSGSLEQNLEKLKANFPDLIDEGFYTQAKLMLNLKN